MTPETKPPRSYQKHGLTALKRAVSKRQRRSRGVLDMRTVLGRALAQWRDDLKSDLGGREAISTQQAAVIDLAVKTKLLLDSIDAWLLTQPSLVNHRKRALLPVVRERQQLADALARYLGQLGLERRTKSVSDLRSYIEQTYGPRDEKAEGASAGVPAPSEPTEPTAPTTRPARQPVPVTRPMDVSAAPDADHHEAETHDEHHHDEEDRRTDQ